MIGGVKHVVVNEGQEETFLELFRTLKSEMTKHEPGNVYYEMKRQTERTASAMRIVFVGTFLIVNLGCGSAESPKPAPSLQPAYPAHWWAPVSKDGAPGWEILPQEAGPGEVILSK